MQHVAVSQPSTSCKALPSNGCYDGDGTPPTAPPANGRDVGHRIAYEESSAHPPPAPDPAPSDTAPPVAIETVNGGAAASMYLNCESSTDDCSVSPAPGVGLLNLSASADAEEEEGEEGGAALPPPPSPTRLSFTPGVDAEAQPDAVPARLGGPVLTASLDPASVEVVTQRMNRVMGEDDELDRSSIYHQPPKAADRDSAARLAKRLFNLDGFRLGDVFKHLCKKNDFSQLVGEEYLNFFDFAGQRLDMALRSFLAKFTLMGETQERERVLAHFSRRYMLCNPETYNSEDACHTLVCAMMLLNTDLHGHNVLRKMSCQDFIGNLAELNNGQNFDRDELKVLYEAIKEEPIQWPQEIMQPQAMFGPQNMSEEARRVLGGGLTGQKNPFLEVPDPNQAQEYRRGYLHRKCVMDAYGKKTALGKRKWKLVFAVVRDLILYLYKNEESVPASFGSLRADEVDPGRPLEPVPSSPSPSALPSPPPATSPAPDAEREPNGAEAAVPDASSDSQASPSVGADSPAASDDGRAPGTPATLRRSGSAAPAASSSMFGAVRIHHSLAVPAPDYTKRQHVFRLTTADGAECLLQAPNAEAVDDWCYSINLAAARLSAAPMAAAVGSERGRERWHRPLLPAFYTQSNTRDQLEQHQKRVLEFTTAKQEHNQHPPKKSDKSRAWHEFNERKLYLEYELERYKTYARILERQLALQFTKSAPLPPLPPPDPSGDFMLAIGMNRLAEENGGPPPALKDSDPSSGGAQFTSERYPLGPASSGFASFTAPQPESKVSGLPSQAAPRQPMIYQNQGAVYEII